MGAKSAKHRKAEQVNMTEEAKETGPVPQSAFVIGDEDEADGETPKFGAKTSPDKDTVAPMQKKPKIKVVQKEIILVAERNKSKIAKFTAAGELYQAFESGIPLQLLDYREFEGRIKKLVYGRATVAIRQLAYVLGRDYDDFLELCDPNSEVSKIITSGAFENPAANEKQDEENKQEQLDLEISINQLLLFGLLYCKGSHSEKC